MYSDHQQGQLICCKLLHEFGWLFRVVTVSPAIEDLVVKGRQCDFSEQTDWREGTRRDTQSTALWYYLSVMEGSNVTEPRDGRSCICQVLEVQTPVCVWLASTLLQVPHVYANRNASSTSLLFPVLCWECTFKHWVVTSDAVIFVWLVECP